LRSPRGERMQHADSDLHVQGVVIELDPGTGLARSIERPFGRLIGSG
jgi:hypothetical protein